MLSDIRHKLYDFLVNRQIGIQQRYHAAHDSVIGVKKYLSWLYLLWLNFCYYFLFCRFLGKPKDATLYEEKNLHLETSESEFARSELPDVSECIEQLKQYDVISFDIFDTLLFRPFSEPTDVFFFVGEKLGILDFKRIRMEMEHLARVRCHKEKGHAEVTLQEIWALLEKETGIPAQEGMQLEMELEKQFCFANPYMQKVFCELQALGKKIVIVSDMYLPVTFLHELLKKNGFEGYEKLYVSCEYEKNKASGSLYDVVKADFSSQRMIHCGDNVHSDIQMAKKQGLATFYYPNVNGTGNMARSFDMSPVIGGAYRGLVNQHLYSGMYSYSMEYEYGFIYGGLFVLGYCNFIHEFCEKNQIDKVLFLARDGDILKQVYDALYPNAKTEYVYWSRAAATKLLAEYNRYDYFRRYLYHKVNQGYSLKKIFKSMDLESLVFLLPEGLKEDEELTDKNVKAVKQFLERYWEEVLFVYQKQQQAARNYFEPILSSSEKVCAVDIGWAGSGAMALSYLVEKVWEMSCEVLGMIAGTNTIHNLEPDASEIFLQSGKLTAYLYAQSFNRDLMKKHDLNKDYNIYWELLLSSATKQFRGFSLKEDGTIELCFGTCDAYLEGILEIQRGIKDFVQLYQKNFKEFPYMLRISGRDAYAPMLVAASKEEAYLKQIKKKFMFQEAVE